MASFYSELCRRSGRSDMSLRDAVALSTRFRRQMAEENGGKAPSQDEVLSAIVSHLQTSAPVHQAPSSRTPSAVVVVGPAKLAAAAALQVFPDACPVFIAKLCEEKSRRYGTQRLTEMVTGAMAAHGYEKKQSSPAPAGTAAVPPPTDFDDKPYEPTDATIQAWHQTYLANVFPLVPLLRIRETYREAKSLSLTWRLLLRVSEDPAVPKLAKPRLLLPVETSRHFDVCHAEVRYMRQLLERESVKRAAVEAATAAGELVECSVCYDSVPEPSAACCSAASDPHFVCETCLRGYVSTELFDNGKAKKACVADGCPGVYAEHAVMSVLNTKGRRAFAVLETRSALAQCGLADAVHTCPTCGDGVIMPEGNTVHLCACGRKTCILCDEEDHKPLSCDEHDEQSVRGKQRRIEEAMTEALIRRCACGVAFVKTDGCNKMTCRSCKRFMCYLCKNMIDGYDHFRADGCPLFGEFETLDEERIKKAAEDAGAAVVPAVVPAAGAGHGPNAPVFVMDVDDYYSDDDYDSDY